MSAVPPIADICQRDWHVCFVPLADIDESAQVIRSETQFVFVFYRTQPNLLTTAHPKALYWSFKLFLMMQ